MTTQMGREITGSTMAAEEAREVSLFHGLISDHLDGACLRGCQRVIHRSQGSPTASDEP
jgi:hypothetical protein